MKRKYKGYFKKRNNIPKRLVIKEPNVYADISISKNLKRLSLTKQTVHGINYVCGGISKKDRKKIARTKDLSCLLHVNNTCNYKRMQKNVLKNKIIKELNEQSDLCVNGKRVHLTSDTISLA